MRSKFEHRILYLAPLFVGSTAAQRLASFRRLGFKVTAIDSCTWFPNNRRGLFSFERRVAWGPGVFAMNRTLLNTAIEVRPDLIWLDKALLIFPATLNKIKRLLPQACLVHYSPDDQFNPDNQSRHYRQSIGLYDFHVTTKAHNLSELQSAGARRVLFQPKAYCPDLHYPRELTAADRARFGAAVGFVGHYEYERAQSILALADSGVSVRIWGPGWIGRSSLQHPNLKIESSGLWDEEYAQALSATEINLCFLRKANRDTSTARSIEIPACGGFMLAERTAEHQELFSEGVEAEYFSSDSELIRQVKYYLDKPDERSAIARAGRLRCVAGGYSNDSRFKRIFMEIFDSAY